MIRSFRIPLCPVFDSLRPILCKQDQLKNRILSGWSIQRVFLLLIGMLILVSAVIAMQWLGAAIGGFLLAMGIFGYRRGAGNCYGGTCTPYGSAGDTGCCRVAEETPVPEESEIRETV